MKKKMKATINIRLFGLENKSFFASHFYMLAFIRFCAYNFRRCVRYEGKEMCKIFIKMKEKKIERKKELRRLPRNAYKRIPMKTWPIFAHKHTYGTCIGIAHIQAERTQTT